VSPLLRHLIAALALGAAAVAAQATPAAPPPPSFFFKRPDIAQAALSPDGSKLAVINAGSGVGFGLAVLDLGTGKTTRAAQFANAAIRQMQWVNDGRLIFSVAGFDAGNGRQNTFAALFVVEADGTGMRQLVSHRIDKEIGRSRLLSWNHKLLRVPTPRPGAANDEVLIARVSFVEQTETPLWLNTTTGQARSVDVEPPPHTNAWLTDGRGELRVALTEHQGRRTAQWRGPGQQGWQLLYETGALETPFNVQAVDNAGQLYVTNARGPGGESVLSRYDFERRAPGDKALVVTPGFDFAGGVIDDGSGAALGVRVVTDSENTVWFDATLKALQAEADRRLPERVNSISCRRCGEPDMVALVRSSSDRDPGQLWLYRTRPADGEPRWSLVGRVRNDIREEQLEQMATMGLERIQARDGRDLPVWVTTGAKADGPRPAVVLVHGGPWVRGATWGWRAEAQFLASRGYVVIEPEFRGSTGYGREHLRAGFRQWGQTMQDDVTDALKWAQAQGLASDKACIVGASYGGYATLMGLAKDPELYRCGVASLAVTDLELLIEGSWWVDDDASDVVRKFQLPEMVGDAKKDAAMIAAYSPVKQAARIRAPVMLVFGEADRRVPLTHGERMRKALIAAGNEPVWVTYPGEGHGFANYQNQLDYMQRMAAFLARHLTP